MAMISSPFFFKFMIAPIMDFNYSRRFGRRMTWIVPCGILTGVMYWILKDSLQTMVETGDGSKITSYLFFTCLLIAIQDVAIDGIVCDILLEKDYDKGALMQSLG